MKTQDVCDQTRTKYYRYDSTTEEESIVVMETYMKSVENVVVSATKGASAIILLLEAWDELDPETKASMRSAVDSFTSNSDKNAMVILQKCDTFQQLRNKMPLRT